MDLLSLFVEQVVAGRLAGWSLSRLAQRRSRERAPLEHGVYVLRNGHGVGVVGAVIVGFVIGMWLLFWVTGFRLALDSEVAGNAFSIMGLIIGGLFVVGGFGGRTRLTVKGIDHRILFLIKWRMEWSEVAAIFFSPTRPHEINIRSKDGRSMVISLAMKGSGTLAEEILKHVPASILETDPEAHARLVRIRQTIAENSPSPAKSMTTNTP